MDNTQPETFGDVLRRQAKEQPDQVALRFGDRVSSYADLDKAANRVANALMSDGLKPDDRIAYLGKNNDAAMELTLGAAKAGVVVVPIIWRLAPDEVAWILGDCGADLLVVDAALGEISEDITSKAKRIIQIGGDAAANGWTDFESWRDWAPDSDPAVPVTPDMVVIQLYTSGTTGRPKGAMLTHANGTGLREAVDAAGIDWMTATPGETAMLVMPFAHIAGVGIALFAIYWGQELIILSEFDTGAVLDVVENHGLRRLFLVPAALQMLLADPRAATTDFSKLDYFSYGASPIPLELLKAGIERLQCQFVQVYGMTETWGSVTALGPEDHGPDRLHVMRSAGKAMPGIEIRILGEDGQSLPPNQVGEIAILSPSNMKGYWNRPEETAKTLDPEGWVKTGDAGLMDEEGYVFIQDRIKDMIISGAENIYPAEVESAIFGHPDVLDVAVIGVPDEKWGEAVKAIIVPKSGSTPDAESIIAHARTKIAGFKCPKSVDFIDVLPRNPSGKILRRALREPYWAGRERNVN